MLRQLHSNAVWPQGWIIVTIAITYALVSSCGHFVEFAFPGAGLAANDVEVFDNLRRGLIAGTAALYAIYRLARFHPAWNQTYGMWLKSTPWSAAKPLPLGPVHLVWQDLALLGAMAAVGWWDARISPLWAACSFALSYLIGMTILLGYTGTRAHCWMLCFLWPALLLPFVRGGIMFAVAAAMFNVAWLGHQSSLRSFPWKRLTLKNRRAVAGGLGNAQIELRITGLPDTARTTSPANLLGWPWLRLSPKLDCYPVSLRASLLWSVLMGWWIYCLTRGLEMPSVPQIAIAFGIVGGLLRLVIYCSAVTAPFSFLARIATGKIIVPGFDRVFLTPILVAAAALLGAMLIRRAGSAYAAVESCVAFGLWFILLSGKPTLRNWLLTGYHRFQAPGRTSGTRQILKPI